MEHDPASKKSRAPRRDAQIRREALISAAAAVFADEGYGAPLELVADRAAVGRATLYRNFPDRAALALSIFSREVDRLEATIDTEAPLRATIALMVVQGAAAASLFARIAADLHAENPNVPAFHALGARLEGVIAPAVERAKARGEIGPAVTPRQIVLAMRMAAALVIPSLGEDQVTAQVEEALSLLMDGLRPR